MLLEKFQISDSPAKFALYESTTGKLKTGTIDSILRSVVLT